MTRILVAGNPALEEDALAGKVAKRLRLRCELLDDPLSILHMEGPLVILDVAKGLQKVQWLQPEQLAKRRMVSLHDFDVQFALTLGGALEKLPELWILAIPIGMELDAAAREVRKALRASPIPLPGSGSRRRSMDRRSG